MGYGIRVDGRQVDLPDDGATLLDVLRDRLGLRSAKDGCSPQGQCGCCTVLVDGKPRVACVTPARRVAGRTITTMDGLAEPVRRQWAEAFCQAGASQCGFCTPGIIVRLASLDTAAGPASPAAVEQALLAHLCRCTGWRSIVAAATTRPAADPERDLVAAARRAALEGGTPQQVGPAVALGEGGFADDLAPPGALVAVPDGAGGWSVGESLAAARAQAGQVLGRRSGATLRHPVDVPAGAWAVTLRTTWVEPAYLEPDSSWCVPGGVPATPLGNGGAFGGKLASAAPDAARRLADRYGRPVRVVFSRQDVVRTGPKRPPVGAGLRADGTGVLRVARTPGIAAAVAAVAPGVVVEEVDVVGPPTSVGLRAAGWAEAAVLLAAVAHLGGAGSRSAPTEADTSAARSPVGTVAVGSGARSPAVSITSPAGARATAAVDLDGDGLPVRVRVTVSCGDPLDEVVLRSYAMGAAHMALGWVCTEGIAVDDGGVPEDVTIRSFGIMRAVDTPAIDVEIQPGAGPPVPGSDAVFAAVAAATWIAQGLPPEWPTRRGRYR